MIKNIIFDLGRVLIEYNPTGYLQSLGYTAEQIQLINAAAFEHPIWLEVDRGTYTFEQFIEIICKENPEISSLLVEVFNANWFDVLKEIPDAVQFMRQLKEEGYRIYILSNFSNQGFAYVEKKYDFFQQADGKVISAHVNMIKPEPAIYEHILQKFNLVPSETVFFDDMPANVDAAKKFGIAAILYANLEDAKKEFLEIVSKS